jgi:hypothetical protein
VATSFSRRSFSVTEFSAMPTGRVDAVGYAWAVDVFAPLVPARGDDLRNALSVTLEATESSGFADFYPGLTGGLTLPALPAPGPGGPTSPPPSYASDIREGLAIFDADGRLHLVEWKTLVLGAEYHAPFARGRRVWLSALLSFTRSNDTTALTPPQELPFVWNDGWYWDANVFVAVTSALQLAASYQVTHQRFGDGETAQNARGQLSAAYYF